MANHMKLIKTIPLSRVTVPHRIEIMSDDIKPQLLNRLPGNYFAKMNYSISEHDSSPE